VKAEILAALLAAKRDKRAVVLLTWIPSGVQGLVDPSALPGDLPTDVAEAARTAAARDTSVTVEREGGEAVFVQPHNPPLRLVLVGAVHIAQPLAQMAALTDFDVTIVDPREAFSTEARFPGVKRSTLWPDKALAELAPDRRTAIVTLTHDPKLDDPALEVALRSEAFYIGCLGSGKTHGSRIERLKKKGFDEAALARIHGPVGLRIGARSPAEIAVSILAQIVERLRQSG
jgi:xanthine dehydrogenase accessory factor